MDSKKLENINIRQASFQYFAKHPWYYFWIITILSIGIGLCIYLKKLEPLYFFIPAIFVIYAYVSSKIRKEIIQQFAQSLGFKYEVVGDMSSVEGNLFNTGSSKSITNVISGVNDGHDVRIFTYTYVVQSGKNSTIYHFTVFENTFHSKMPHILLYKSIPFLTSTSIPFSGTNYVSLEGEFDKHFALHVEKEYEIEALQVFTPDFMEELIKTSKAFSFEFYKNKLYIYKRGLIGSSKELHDMFSLADKVCERLEPIVNSLEDDVKSMNEAFKK